MSLNFPSSPAPGDVFTAEGTTFVWTGTVWVVRPGGLIFATDIEAEAGDRWDRAMSPLRGADAYAANPPPSVPVESIEARCVAVCYFAVTTIIWGSGISGVTKPGTGIYELTFTTPRPSTNYFIDGLCEGITNHPLLAVCPDLSVKTTNLFRIRTGPTGGSGTGTGSAAFLADTPSVRLAVFAWD